MTTDIRIVAGGVTNYLINATGSPTPAGPATAAATTPFSLLRDDWTMQASQPVPAYQGGPPFRNGSTLAYQAYGNTQQTIPITVQGISHDASVAFLRALRQLINQTIAGNPAILYYQPNGATNPLYFEIQSGAVQERSGPLNPGAGFAYIEADVILTLSPFGGRLTTPETLINSSGGYIVGGGTGTIPSTSVPYSGGAGDLAFEGQPLNIKVTPTNAAGTIGEVWAATMWGHTATPVNIALNVPAGAATSVGSGSSLLANYAQQNSAAFRVVCRVTNTTGGAVSKYYLQIRGSYGATGAPLWSSQGVSPTNEVNGLVDFGPIPLDVIRNVSPMTGNLSFDFYATKTAGTPTLITFELLVYSTFCKISGLALTTAGAQYLWLQSFRQVSGRVCLPTVVTASNMTSANAYYLPAVIRGVPPVYLSGSNLWLQWLNASGQSPTAATMTATVLVTHAPLYFTMRGAG